MTNCVSSPCGRRRCKPWRSAAGRTNCAWCDGRYRVFAAVPISICHKDEHSFVTPTSLRRTELYKNRLTIRTNKQTTHRQASARQNRTKNETKAPKQIKKCRRNGEDEGVWPE